jgi:hypothetical protein
MEDCNAYPLCGCTEKCEAHALGLSGQSLHSLALVIAAGQEAEGVHEEGGDNHGARVNWYQEEGGSGDGSPWCADFVNWCAKFAADILEIHSPLEDVSNQAYVQSYVDHFAAQGMTTKRPGKVEPGYLFALWFPKLNRYGHIGFVKSIDMKAWTFTTVEGNSNDEGSREGKEVCSNTRPITDRVLFIRWADKP